MSEDYRLFVNEDRTVMVRVWLLDEQVPERGEVVEVATREDYNDVWGPPVIMKEER